MTTKNKQVLFKIPENIHRGFKTACSKNGEIMSKKICKFMENYAKSQGTYVEVSIELEAEKEISELGL